MYGKGSQESAASTLLQYFVHPIALQFQSILYTEYYQQYTFYLLKSNQPQENDLLEQESSQFSCNIVWLRAQNEAIARIDTVSPHTGELFYLCALLLHKPTYSFVDLRTGNGVIYPTFKEAASAMSLFENQSEGREVMKEAIESFCSSNHQQKGIGTQTMSWHPGGWFVPYASSGTLAAFAIATSPRY